MKPQCQTQLTKQRRATHNYTVTAKSVTRIGIRQYSKAYSRLQRFFCTAIQHPAFMAGLLGASPEAPVSFEAGYANPDNSATKSEIGISFGGSIFEGVFLMTTHVIYPRTCRKVIAVVYMFILPPAGRIAA